MWYNEPSLLEETNNDVPYWRTIKNNGELNEKYLGGAERTS